MLLICALMIDPILQQSARKTQHGVLGDWGLGIGKARDWEAGEAGDAGGERLLNFDFCLFLLDVPCPILNVSWDDPIC